MEKGLGIEIQTEENKIHALHREEKTLLKAYEIEKGKLRGDNYRSYQTCMLLFLTE